MIPISDECIHKTCYEDSVNGTYCFNHLSLDDVVHTALRNGATVEIDLQDEYGYLILIDGVSITEYTDECTGLPHELLGGPFGQEKLTEQAREKVLEQFSQKGESGE